MNKETVEDICAFVGIINHSSENGEGGGGWFYLRLSYPGYFMTSLLGEIGHFEK